MSRLSAAAFAVLLLAAAPLHSPAAQSPRLKRWEVSVQGSRSWGRPAGAIETAMRDGGLGDARVSSGFCYLFTEVCFSYDYDLVVAYPHTVRGDETRTLAVSYLLRPWLRIRVQHGSADLGSTTGHREPGGYLGLSQRVSTVAALAVVGEGLHVGVGPSMNGVRVGTEGQGTRSVARLGAVLHAGLRVPERKRFFLTVTAQYHFVRSVDVGPYTVWYDWAGDSTVTMPRTRVPVSYRQLHAGFGLAL
ncbi:MAG: hypothetical protein ACREN5_10450 [Gemmatimonadales bacterium]